MPTQGQLLAIFARLSVEFQPGDIGVAHDESGPAPVCVHCHRDVHRDYDREERRNDHKEVTTGELLAHRDHSGLSKLVTYSAESRVGLSVTWNTSRWAWAGVRFFSRGWRT